MDRFGGGVVHLHYILSSQSDPPLVSCVLAAIDMHLIGRRRWAVAALTLASLGRPEAWPALFLYSQKSEVLAVSMYSMWLDGSYTTVCAIGTLMIIVLAIAVLLVRKLGSSPATRMASGTSMPSVPVQTTLTVPQG